MQKRIAVIGGGITGLALTYNLLQMQKAANIQFHVTLFEQDNHFGGKIQTERHNGLIMETGPDSMLARKIRGLSILSELGLDREFIGTSGTALKTYILHNGRLEHLPPGTNMGIPMQIAPFASTRLISIRGKIRALGDLFISRRAHQGDVSLGHFLRRRFGNELVENIAEPLMAGIYAGKIDDLSLQATFAQFDDLEKKYRSLILGSIAQRKIMHKKSPSQSTNSGKQTGAPSTRSAFVTLPQGLSDLVARIEDAIKDQANMRLNTQVTAITQNEDNTYSIDSEQKNQSKRDTFDAILVATPTYHAASLLVNIVPEAKLLKDIVYGSTATVMTAFKRNDVPDLDASGFVVPRAEKRAITACTWVSSKWPHSAPKGQILVRCYVGRSGDVDTLALDDQGIIKAVLNELQSILGIDAKPTYAKVTRWDQAMPQYRVNHEQIVRQVEEALMESAPAVKIAGAGYHGLGVPDCMLQAQAVAKQITDYLVSK